jgi:hypothetical protein
VATFFRIGDTVIKSACTYIFLRLYARNLTRSRRADPAAACSDAIMQTGMFVALPAISTGWVVATLLWPAFSGHVKRLDATFLVPSVGLALLIAYFVNSQFRGYSRDPGAADPYLTRSRTLTRFLFILLPVSWTVLAGLALHWLAGRP